MPFEIIPDALHKVRGFTAGSSVTFECKDNESAKKLREALNKYVEGFNVGKHVPTQRP